MDQEWKTEITEQAREAIDRILHERPGIGAAYLFPLTSDRSRPIRQETVAEWLHKAERLAGIEKLNGSSPVTLQCVYQGPDEAGVRKAVLEPLEIREAR
jgi:hypothetical protein